MTWKQIETSREVRLWVKEIAIPVVATFAAACYAFPEFRKAVKTKASNMADKIKSKFKKEEEGPA